MEPCRPREISLTNHGDGAHWYAPRRRALPLDRRYASVLPRASRKHLVCMRAHNGSKTLWNWLPIQFTGGRKRKRRVAPALPALAAARAALAPTPLIFFLIHFLPLSLLLVRSRDLGTDSAIFLPRAPVLYIIRSSPNKPCLTFLISHFVLLYSLYLNLSRKNLIDFLRATLRANVTLIRVRLTI